MPAQRECLAISEFTPAPGRLACTAALRAWSCAVCRSPRADVAQGQKPIRNQVCGSNPARRHQSPLWLASEVRGFLPSSPPGSPCYAPPVAIVGRPERRAAEMRPDGRAVVDTAQEIPQTRYIRVSVLSMARARTTNVQDPGSDGVEGNGRTRRPVRSSSSINGELAERQPGAARAPATTWLKLLEPDGPPGFLGGFPSSGSQCTQLFLRLLPCSSSRRLRSSTVPPDRSRGGSGCIPERWFRGRPGCRRRARPKAGPDCMELLDARLLQIPAPPPRKPADMRCGAGMPA